MQKSGGFFNTSMPFVQVFWSWLGAFLGIATVALITSFILDGTGYTLVVGSFGASAVLIYGAVESPLAQPRNLIGGHIISALIGVSVFKICPDPVWLAAPLSVSLAIAAMQISGTLHPPGGATALIAVIGNEQIHQLGYYYVLVPIAVGATIMLSIALVVNYCAPGRNYPKK